MLIRKAKYTEHQKLTEISFESKGYWDYPDEYFDIWRNELTITAEYINIHRVYVAEIQESVVGYYSIVNLPQDIEVSGIFINKGFWLEHMFILPSFIGKRIGTNMVSHLIKVCNDNNIKQISVLADPNSKTFYEKMGFQYEKEYPSTINGRSTPLLEKENIKTLTNRYTRTRVIARR